MAILKTSQLGNPILRQKAEEVSPSKPKNPVIQRFINDMVITMREYDGVGLAAPQVHESIQIAVIEAKKNPRYHGSPDIPLLVLVNPVFISKSKSLQRGWEGCLSVEGFRGLVPRSQKVEIRYFDRKARKRRLSADGFLAVVIQHEMDHLTGEVFLDRMEGLSTLTHLKEYARYWIQTSDD